MATMSPYPDSRALLSVAIGARSTGVYSMENLLGTARFNMRHASDRAEAHRQFVTMFAVAGMTREAAWHEKQAASESAMADVWAGFYAELAA